MDEEKTMKKETALEKLKRESANDEAKRTALQIRLSAREFCGREGKPSGKTARRRIISQMTPDQKRANRKMHKLGTPFAQRLD